MSADLSITDLLRRYEDLRSAGQPATPEEVCRDCPELVDLLKQHLLVLGFLDSVLVNKTDDSQTVEAPAAGGAPAAPPAGSGAGPRYRALRFHAQGGLGEVHIAEDSELHRRVALKRIQERHADSGPQRRRFLREAELTARLEHPGVVPVHGLVQDAGGRPCYAMRFIEGESLKEAIERFHALEKQPGHDEGERRLALRDMLSRFLAVCNTVAFAHDRGIVHRDLKPANVMLGRYGETFVVDWGLAKYLGAAEGEQGPGTGAAAAAPPLSPALTLPPAEGLTAPGQVAGTPAYMSPEQAAGRWGEVGPASDIYSLGAMLYELLTGQVPFPGPDPAEVLRRVQRGDFARPRQVRAAVPRALEAVCLKAMALPPADRYATALELKAEVEHWLADEPVLAYREPVAVRLGRWARRHKPAVAAVAGAVLVALLLGGAGLVWAQRQAEKRDRAVEAALAKAADLQRQARWAEARAVLEEAESRLGERGPKDLRGRLDQARRDLDLVARLDAIRLKRATLVEGRFDTATAAPAYAAAFQEAGLGAVGEDTQQVAARVRGSAVRAELVAALDDWAAFQPLGPRLTWVLAVVRKADPDPWRDRVRDPRVWNNKRRLAWLARGARGELVPPRFRGLLGMHLQWLGGEAEALLRAAQERRPGDFWINFELGNALALKKKAGVAVGYYRAALAVRPGIPAVLNNLGVALTRQGQLAEAVKEFRRALSLDPKEAQVHSNLGATLAKQGKLGEAGKECRRAIALDPKYAKAHINLGAVLSSQGKVAEAVRECRRAIALDPKYAQAHNNLGIARQNQGKMAEAVAAFRKAIALDPKLVLPHVNLGFALMAQGKLDEAIREFRRAIKLDPKDASAHFNLGNALKGQGKWAAAVKEYRRAIELDPKGAQAHSNLGIALKAQGQLAAAAREFRRAIALDLKLAPAHYHLGAALFDQGKLAEAVKECRRAIKLDPKDAKAHSNLGTALKAQGRLAAAVKAYRRAIKLDPKDAKAHSNLGTALRAQGRLAAAVKAYRRAIKLDPKDAPAHFNLGNALKAQGQLAAAVKAYRRAIDLDPKDAHAHINLGNALRDQNQSAAAEREYRRAIKLAPKLAPAHFNLGGALYDQGKRAEAVKAYRRAIKLDPRHAKAHHYLGLALSVQNKLAEAVKAFRQAIILDPKLAKAHGALGQALLRWGRFAEAGRATQRCLDLLPAGHPLRPVVTQQLRRCQQLLALDQKLTALLWGDRKPDGPAEQLGLGYLCLRYKKRYAAALRFYSAAFATQPNLADNFQAGYRYHAGCAAAMAGCGQGEDGPKLNAEERSRWRKQAVAWLRADLALWAKHLKTNTARAKEEVRKRLRHWQGDPNLAGLRDPAGLAKLSPEEREACRKLWAEVATLLKKASPK
jgi:tetratricopeptide (TPR) repeat protein/tRNA A-37 threonylcarbamoyl transferase component Bud32